MITKHTADWPQSKNETENKNNKKNTNEAIDIQVKTNDNHFLGPSDHLLEQQKATTEADLWKKERMAESNRQQQQKQNQLDCKRQCAEGDEQYRQQEVQRRAHQQLLQEQQVQEHQGERNNWEIR